MNKSVIGVGDNAKNDITLHRIEKILGAVFGSGQQL
jgi:hypothetical protein